MNRLLIAGLSAATASLLVAGCNGDDPTLPTGQPHTIDVFPISLSIETGLSEQLEVSVIDHHGDIVDAAAVTATSSNPEVATVTMTETGAVVNAVSAGTAHLTFRSADAFPVHVTVRVFDPPVPTTWQAYPRYGSLAVGQEVDLIFRIFDQEGERRGFDEYPEDFTIDIVSADPDVISVDGQTLVAVGEGEATITLNGFGQTAGGDAFELDPVTLNLTVREADAHTASAFFDYTGDFQGAFSVQSAFQLEDGWPDVPVNYGVSWFDDEFETQDIYILTLTPEGELDLLYLWTVPGSGEVDGGYYYRDINGDDEEAFFFPEGSALEYTQEDGVITGTFAGGTVPGLFDDSLEMTIFPGTFRVVDLDYFAGAGVATMTAVDRIIERARELRRSR